MSDEERKAVDKINKLVEYLRKWNENVTIVSEDAKYFEKILDMTKTHLRMIDENIEEILEQQTEIEELKEKCKEVVCIPEGTCFMFEPKDVDKKWEDKIKAKIEEVQNMKAKAKDIVFKSSLNYIETELQSLLEKE